MKGTAGNRGVVLALACAALLALQPATARGGKLKAGDPLPRFTGTDVAGNEFDTETTKGKVLLIDFWSINCISCLEEMPHLVNLYNRYRDQGLVTVGINMDRSTKRVKRFIDKSLPYEMTYRNVIDQKAVIMRLLGIQMLPTNILVDPSGVVRLFHAGYKPGFEKELEEEIHKLLPEGTSGKQVRAE